MAVKQSQADLPGPPLRHVVRPRRGHQEGAREVAHRGPHQVRRAQHARPHHLAPSRRRGEAPVPQDRLQAPEGRRARRVAAIEYDPNRTAYIALVNYADGDKRYILAPNRLRWA